MAGDDGAQIPKTDVPPWAFDCAPVFPRAGLL